jgi:outer membrane receptor protein involved in Fe transport
VGLSYQVEDYSQNTDNQQSVINALMIDGVLDLKTQRVPLTLSYFHPSGLTLSLDASRYHQTGRYIANAHGATVETGRDKFWLADLNAAWRLPKRAGSISLGVKNLFDQTFRFEDRNSYETLSINRSATPSTLSPERLFYGRISFSFR